MNVYVKKINETEYKLLNEFISINSIKFDRKKWLGIQEICELDSHYQRDGISIYFYGDGSIQSRGIYKKNKRSGYFVHFDRHGYKLFEGNYEKNRKNGYCTYFFPKNKIYKCGFYRRGIMDGIWKQFHIDSDENYYQIFEGSIKNNKYCGNGKLMTKEGLTSYDGNFQNNKIHGYGKSYIPSTKLIGYNGKWKNNKYHGHGKMYSFQNNTYFLSYCGNFSKGKFDSYGNLYNLKETTNDYDDNVYLHYMGSFRKNKKHGLGTLYSSMMINTPIFFGSFNKDVIDGHGIQWNYDINNTFLYTFEGFFKRGRWHGNGVIYSYDNQNIEGFFSRGELKSGMKYNDGLLIYDGSFSNFEYSGHGKLIEHEKNSLYFGNFKQNEKHGKGCTLSLDDGHLIHEGYYLKGSMKLESPRIIKEKFILKSMFDLNEIQEIHNKSISTTSIKSFLNDFKIPFTRYTKRKQLIQIMLSFFAIKKAIHKKQVSELSTIHHQYLKKLMPIFFCSNGQNSSDKIQSMTKKMVINTYDKKMKQQRLVERERYDLFGNRITNPVIGNDLQLYDFQSMKKLQEMKYQPISVDGKPLIQFYSFSEILKKENRTKEEEKMKEVLEEFLLIHDSL
jgi:hypothetical protein